MGVTGKRVEKSCIGGRVRTMAGAGPTDLLYVSRGVPAAYRNPGKLGPHVRYSVLGRGAEPPQFWVLLIWLEPGI